MFLLEKEKKRERSLDIDDISYIFNLVQEIGTNSVAETRTAYEI